MSISSEGNEWPFISRTREVSLLKNTKAIKMPCYRLNSLPGCLGAWVGDSRLLSRQIRRAAGNFGNRSTVLEVMTTVWIFRSYITGFNCHQPPPKISRLTCSSTVPVSSPLEGVVSQWCGVVRRDSLHLYFVRGALLYCIPTPKRSEAPARASDSASQSSSCFMPSKIQDNSRTLSVRTILDTVLEHMYRTHTVGSLPKKKPPATPNPTIPMLKI